MPHHCRVLKLSGQMRYRANAMLLNRPELRMVRAMTVNHLVVVSLDLRYDRLLPRRANRVQVRVQVSV